MSGPVSSFGFTQATRRELNPRQAETVEKVAAAAGLELRDVGFDGLTVHSVAQRAGVALHLLRLEEPPRRRDLLAPAGRATPARATLTPRRQDRRQRDRAQPTDIGLGEIGRRCRRGATRPPAVRARS